MNEKLLCPICDNKTYFKFKIDDKKTDRRYFECGFCHFLFQGKVPNINRKLYEDNYDWDAEDPGSKERSKLMEGIIEEQIKDKNKTILDYGCGQGHLVLSLKNKGYKAYGYDPYLDIKNKKEIFFSHLRDLDGRKFDVILAVETIEHFQNPKKELSTIFKYLKNDGIFIFTTQIYNKSHNNKWHYLSLAHCSLYSIESLEILAKQFGFKKRRPIKEKFKNFDAYLIGQTWFRNGYFSRFSWNFDNLRLNLMRNK